MRHELPPRPHIEHLKKQAKDLLNAHRAGERAALERIAESLPALAGRTPEQVQHAALALHDAQSVIAREYGFRSWSELRAAVAARTTASYSEANLRAMMAVSYTIGVPLSDEVFADLRAASAARERAAAAASAPLPERLLLLPVRNWLMMRPSIAPLYIGRPSSLAAVQAAAASPRPTLVACAQRVESEEEAQLAGLHPIGCEVLLHSVRPGLAAGQAFAVFEALRQVRLTALEPAASPGDARYARVEPYELDVEQDAEAIDGLAQQLRGCAGQLAGLLPEPEPAREMIAALDDQDLPSAIVQNLQLSVAERARLAEEPRLVERLRMALGWAEAARVSLTPAG